MTTPISGFQRPEPDVAIAGQPSSDQLKQLKQEGFRAVVNLRPSSEQTGFDEPAETGRLGLRYFHIPVADAGGLTRDAVKALDEVLQDPGNLPVLVHCGSGNRVGALFALRAAWLRGLAVSDAIETGRRHGLTKLEDDVRRILSS
jgi:uncharacterized protein (TIGR01244 family)